MLHEIQKNLSPFLKNDQTLILGLSGGHDSVFLLYTLAKLQKKLGFRLIAAHLNHQLRGQKSRKDADFCQKLCKKLNILFEIQSLNIKKIAKTHKKNLEECGRDHRYAFFRELKKKYKADWILTAHHLDDNIETVLMNFTRGCGINGIAGMEIQNGDILRPLLTIPKENILNFLAKNHIAYREDATNLNKKFVRNFTRLEIVPRLRKLNPNFNQTFIRNWTYFQDLKHFLSLRTLRHCEESNINNGVGRRSNRSARATKPSLSLKTSSFHSRPPFLQSELLKNIHQKLLGSTKSLSQTQIHQALTFLKNPKTGKQKTFGNITAFINYDRIEFFQKNLAETTTALKETSLTIPGKTFVPFTNRTGGITIKTALLKKIPKNLSQKNSLFLDANTIRDSTGKWTLSVRSWQLGDRITPLGMTGHKKIHDLFIDKKIPQKIRQLIPVFTHKNQIVATGTLTLSQFHQISQKTLIALKISLSDPA